MLGNQGGKDSTGPLARRVHTHTPLLMDTCTHSTSCSRAHSRTLNGDTHDPSRRPAPLWCSHMCSYMCTRRYTETRTDVEVQIGLRVGLCTHTCT